MALDPAYISVRIRDLLRVTRAGLTIPAIAEQLGEDVQKVRESVNTMVSRTGGVMATGRSGRFRVYTIADAVAVQKLGRKGRREFFLTPLRQGILDAVREWPLPIAEIARKLNDSYARIGSELFKMERAGLVKVCGTAAEAGYTERSRATTRVFGLPAHPILPSVVQFSELPPHRPPKPRARTQSGSGVIAPPPYRTGYRGWGWLGVR